MADFRDSFGLHQIGPYGPSPPMHKGKRLTSIRSSYIQ
jgi:hypothetical protein